MINDEVRIITTIAGCVIALVSLFFVAIFADSYLRLKCYEVNKERTAVELKLLCS